MKITLRCNECDEELQVTATAIHTSSIILQVTPCPTCQARVVQLAKENEWICDNILRKGKIA